MKSREAPGLYPLSDLRRVSESPARIWAATGPRPTFAFGPAAVLHLLSGQRVRIRCRAEAMRPTLAVEAEGDAAPRRFRLTPSPDGTDDLIRLPPGIRALRLEIPEGSLRFRLDAASVEPVGRLTAAHHAARRILDRLPPQERHPLRLLRRIVGLLRTVPPGEIWRRLTRAARTERAPAPYAAWIEQVERPALPSGQRAAAILAALPDRPLISVLMAARPNEPARIAEALASLRAQLYPDWELCCAAEPSSALEALAAEEPRLRLLPPDPASTALGTALARAGGDWIVPLDSDARLAPQALLACIRQLAAEPDLDLLYSDEDRIGPDGQRCDPFFKPDWSPETLEAGFYIGGLALFRAALAREAGGFPPESAGAEVYDLTLRLTERTERVGHLAQVLCHRRGTGLDPEAASRALAARAERTGGLAVLRRLDAERFALRRRLASRPLVSIVIPTAGRHSVIGDRTLDLLTACLASLRETSTYETMEIVVVEHGHLPEPARAAMDRYGARGVPYPDPAFHFAAKMNLGARGARGDILVFLNDDIAVITPDWIEAMLALLARPGVGAVGPRLLFEDGSLQHAGVVFGEGLPDHVCRGRPGDDPGYHGSSLADRTCLAVTGACLMVRRADFEAIGGFDENYAINYNDIDLCLRLRERGLRTVYCAQAALYHYESRNRIPTVDPAEQARFRRRWGAWATRDPYYPDAFGIRPPAFTLDAERFPAAARRMVEAWR